ncbi:IMPACT family protein [Fluviicola chungangensis]|uniref:YigZ family protein n=1 Tax=Fluviicola chungangensis TaxID=2597671 RepID=A0A556N7X9_9FLAO|nr:YigZ family protein [Fluviicola chungangensis]TSJ48193.1 YigZ family protein [Fluviicola chungangensis]
MSESKFKTISELSEGFYKEKGSKFLAFAIPCKTEDEIKEHIQRLRKEHYQAVHVCSAFRLGSDKKKYRASDDGEPSNSAGAPILGQIQSFDLTNILIAVVRYYGGINLGVGGLINAYRTASKDALENAQIIEQEDEILITLQYDYSEMPQVMSVLKNSPAKIIEQDFQLSCKLSIQVPVSEMNLLEQFSELNLLLPEEKHIRIENHGIIQ